MRKASLRAKVRHVLGVAHEAEIAHVLEEVVHGADKVDEIYEQILLARCNFQSIFIFVMINSQYGFINVQ